MKKRTAVILCVIIAATLLAACASGEVSFAPAPAQTMMWSEDANQATAHMSLADMPDAEYAYDDIQTSGFGTESDTAGGGIAGITAPVNEGFAEKIIYSVFADIETVTFDETIAGVNALLVSYNAFIENSSISGQNYASQFYGWHDYRHANFTIRVPKEHLDAMTDRLENLGNVVHRSSSAENITSQFIDTQSRLNALSIEEESLLDMMSKAEDVPDLIIIQERLSDVRYQIESITSILKNWQNQVDYSTLTLSIREVEQFTERVEIHRTYWQQIGDGFMSTIRGVGRFFMDLFKWIIIAAPVLVILAVIAVGVVIIVRMKLKSIAKKKADMPKTSNPYQYPPAQMNNYEAPPDRAQSQENEKQ